MSFLQIPTLRTMSCAFGIWLPAHLMDSLRLRIGSLISKAVMGMGQQCMILWRCSATNCVRLCSGWNSLSGWGRSGVCGLVGFGVG